MTWVVYDPYSTCLDEFPTEAEAVTYAEGLIDGFIADDTWDEGVEQIVVAKLTHHIAKRVLGVKAEMSAEAWERMTGGNNTADEWWRFDLVRAQITSNQPTDNKD